MSEPDQLSATDRPGVFEPYTHQIWRCQNPECGHEVWLPRRGLGIQSDHANRPFCTCDDQGVRLVPVTGVGGRIRL